MATSTTAKIDLASLSDGMPGLTPPVKPSLAESAAVCLENRTHQVGVALHLTGFKFQTCTLQWSAVDKQRRRCYNDLQEATERGGIWYCHIGAERAHRALGY